MFLCNRNICLLLILRLKHVVKEKTYWKRLDAFSFGKKTTQETDDDALGIKKKHQSVSVTDSLELPVYCFFQTILMMMCIQNYNFTSLIETIRNAAFFKVSLCLVFLR